jgi:hypothetical protein
MKTTINNTEITLEMSSFEKHTHDAYLIHGPKPFRFAYITMRTETFNDASDKARGHWIIEETQIECFVNVYLTNNITPELRFEVVNVESGNYDTHSVEDIEDTLAELTQAIKYHEI